MEERKHVEEMWCFSCDGIWETQDYYNCNQCVHCGSTSRLYRTSSFSYFYAYLERHPEEKKKIDEDIADAKEKYEKSKQIP
jgi:glutaredoxin